MKRRARSRDGRWLTRSLAQRWYVAGMLLLYPIHAAALHGQQRDSMMGDMGDSAMAGMEGMGGGMIMREATAETPIDQIHATPPKDMTFGWKVIRLPELENPLRSGGSMADHLEVGKRVFYQNCIPCHGPRLYGEGHFAQGLTVPPRRLNDPMFLPMHPESYVFWRIAKGAPALPGLAQPENSAMPVFENILTEDEIWSVVLFLYEQQGFTPGSWMWTEEQMARGGAHIHIMQD